jgi:hypothetical protein
MPPAEEPFDVGPTAAEAKRIRALTSAQVSAIDAVLISFAHHEWRKVARVVGSTMLQLRESMPGLPDVYYALRIAELVRSGKLEAQGDLRRMRFSEVRLPQ